MNNKFKKNKLGQTGDTITWLVATVVIIVVLTVSIFAASIFFDKNKSLKSGTFESADTLASKSLFSYVITKDSNGKVVYEQLKEEENLGDFDGKLSVKIFIDLYKKEYLTIWAGFFIDRTVSPYLSNEYFGARVFKDEDRLITEEIKLKEDKSLFLDLSKAAYSK